MVILLRDWVLWWLSVLQGMPGKTPGVHPVALKIHRNGTTLIPGLPKFSNTDIAPIESELFSIAALAHQIDALNAATKQSYTVGLDENRAIIRKLSSTSLPASRMVAAALLDMETSTPFTAREAHALMLHPNDNDQSAHYAIVKRSVLDPVLAVLNQARATVTTLSIDQGDKRFVLTASSKAKVIPRRLGTRQRVALSMLAACGILCAATLAHYTYQYRIAIDRLTPSLLQLELDAKAMRARLNESAARLVEVQALRASLDHMKPTNIIWEEIARVLPDQSFLTDMTLSQNNVSIAGYSKAASSIILALDGSAMFEDVAFTGPVVKVPGRDDVRFAVDMKVSAK